MKKAKEILRLKFEGGLSNHKIGLALTIFGRPTWSCDNLRPIAAAMFAFAKIRCTAIARKRPPPRCWGECKWYLRKIDSRLSQPWCIL